MTIFAYIQDNTVVNTVVAEQDWINSRADKECYIELGQENLVQIGSKLIDDVFYPPQPYPVMECPAGEWLKVSKE